MAKPKVALCLILLTALPSCGGDNDANKDAGRPCFIVTPDDAALASGAMPGKQTQCVGFIDRTQRALSDGSPQSVNHVIIEGEGNQRPSPDWATDVFLQVTYLGEDVVPVTFHASDACVYPSPSSQVELRYGAYDPTDDSEAEWSCTTCMDASAIFEMSITSVVPHPGSILEDPVHGELHAVCGPNRSPPAGTKQGRGNVTIDGPF